LERHTFNGEFSIFSTLGPGAGNVTQIWKDLLKNFAATEITLPQDLDELIEAGVYLAPLKSVINEDLWIQVVHSHQYMPGLNTDVDNEFIKITDLLKEDFDMLLSDVHKREESREYLVRSMLHQSKYNLKRVAQSFARADEKDKLDGDYFKKARNLLVDNFTGFINHPEFHTIKSIMKKRKENVRYSIVQTEIINNPYSSTAEIFESVKSTKYFKDIYDLQDFLDWLHKKGYVIVNIDKKYRWV